MVTAVNIDGSRLTHPGERKDTWRRDIRMAEEFQPDGEFYEVAKGNDPVKFSRVHLVRRIDPCWGTLAESKLAEMHTFHYSNATPQVQHYNDVEWGDLEDYIIDRIQTKEKKLTVFTGPIFRKNDPIYGRKRKGGPWQIPVSYWKIAVIQKTPDTIAAAAFIIGQTQYVRALYEAKVFTKLSPYTLSELQTQRLQTTVRTIETETGLNFAPLRAHDSMTALESTRQTRLLFGASDIVI